MENYEKGDNTKEEWQTNNFWQETGARIRVSGFFPFPFCVLSWSAVVGGKIERRFCWFICVGKLNESFRLGLVGLQR